MLSIIDHPTDDTAYGYTKDDDGTTWYWSVSPPENVVHFRNGDYGYPVGHPIKTGGIPEHVRDHAQTHVDALLELNEADDPRIPWA